jgi:hypothetical protein
MITIRPTISVNAGTRSFLIYICIWQLHWRPFLSHWTSGHVHFPLTVFTKMTFSATFAQLVLHNLSSTTAFIFGIITIASQFVAIIRTLWKDETLNTSYHFKNIKTYSIHSASMAAIIEFEKSIFCFPKFYLKSSK